MEGVYFIFGFFTVYVLSGFPFRQPGKQTNKLSGQIKQVFSLRGPAQHQDIFKVKRLDNVYKRKPKTNTEFLALLMWCFTITKDCIGSLYTLPSYHPQGHFTKKRGRSSSRAPLTKKQRTDSTGRATSSMRTPRDESGIRDVEVSSAPFIYCVLHWTFKMTSNLLFFFSFFFVTG